MESLITEEAIVGRSSQAVTGSVVYYEYLRYMYVHADRRAVGGAAGRGRTEVRRDVSQKLRQIAKLPKLLQNAKLQRLPNNKSKKVIAMTMREDTLLPLAVLASSSIC